MMRPAITPAAIAALWLVCPCGWKGRGSQAIVKTDDVVRCPKCQRPVETAARQGYVTKGT